MTDEPQTIDFKKLHDRTGKVYVFDKRIFRTGILLMLVLFIIGLFLYGYKDRIYAECPADSFTGMCHNPFYERCDDLRKMRLNNETLTQALYVCKQKYLMPGSRIGTPPPSYIGDSMLASGLIIVLCFVFNHLACNRPGQLKRRREHNGQA